MNYAQIRRIVGNLIILVSGFMVAPLAFAAAAGEPTATAFAVSMGVSLALGLALRSGRAEGEIGVHEAFIIVAAGWGAVSLLGALPFYLGGTFAGPIDALFESVSGFTTTGATVLADVESQPRSILLWRSLLNWLGGLGIVVLFIALFRGHGFGGMQLFNTEMPGLMGQKIRPRISETGRLMWGLYVALTLVLTALLWAAGLPLFDAALHALTAIATGGFSTKNLSVEAFGNPAAEWILAAFMFLGATNFVLLYRLLRHGEIGPLARNREFLAYLGVVVVASLLVAAGLWGGPYPAFGEALRKAVFQVVAIVTTTGFTSANFDSWPFFPVAVLLVLMFTSGMAGSTSGGPKMIRIVIAAKHALLGFRRLVHPRSVEHLHLGEMKVPTGVATAVGSFLFLYLLVFAVSFLVLGLLGLDAVSTATMSIAALGNIGPGLGAVGPYQDYGFLPAAAKLYLCFLMILGRLEIYSVFILFFPAFWKRK